MCFRKILFAFLFYFCFFQSNCFCEELDIYVYPENEVINSTLPICKLDSYVICRSTLNDSFTIVGDSSWQNEVASRYKKIRINISQGLYRIPDPLFLEWHPRFNIPLEIIGKDDKTIISGALAINKWRNLGEFEYLDRVAYGVRKNLRVADISWLPREYSRQRSYGFRIPVTPRSISLFYYGRELPLASWPNSGYGKIDALKDLQIAGSNKFRIFGRSATDWQLEPDVMFHAFWFYNWSAQSYHGYVDKEGIVNLEESGVPYGINSGQRIRVENALSELDEEGEWYFDRLNKQLIAWLPNNAGEYEISYSESALRIQGSSNVSVRNIYFEKFRGDSISVKNSFDVKLSKLSIAYSGNRAVVVSGGKRCGIVDSIIQHSGEGGVVLQGGDRVNLVSAMHYVKGATISDFSRYVKTYRYAVDLNGVGNVVDSNLIFDSPHVAIHFFGNNHKIINNEIFDVVKETGDSGAIYVGRDFTSRGTVIDGNFIHDIRSSDRAREVKGIYLDDQASGIVVSNNVFARVQQPVFIGGGRDNLIVNNLFYESSPAIHLDGRGVGWQKEMTFNKEDTLQRRLDAVPFANAVWIKSYPHLRNIREDDFGRPKYNLACGNIVVHGEKLRVLDNVEDGIKVFSFMTAGEDIFSESRGSVRVKREDFTLRNVNLNSCKELDYE